MIRHTHCEEHTHGVGHTRCEGRHGFGHTVVELLRDELTYDVKNTLYIFARGQEGQGVAPRKMAMVYDVGEDGNRDKLARLLDAAVEDCREKLYALTRREGREAYASDLWEEVAGAEENGEEEYLLRLSLPVSMSATSVRTMAVYMHDYVVNTVAKEWLLLVYAEGAAQFAALADDAEARMKSAARKVARARRIRMSTF